MPTDPATLVTTRPRTRMENWQRKLLDLSLRNNLLNTRAQSKSQLELVCPAVAELEDALAQGTSFRIKTLPESVWEQADGAPLSQEILQQHAASMFHKRELLAPVPAGALERSLRGIYTAAHREMEESGANTLYIACGFLKWTPRDRARAAQLKAPLLLAPVRLQRANVRDGFTLSGMDEDAHMNHTLLELLKTEFSLYIPELEGELPRDEAGLDVPRILEIVRAAIAEQPEWAVEESCMLGMFSFAKYLMWKDLVERGESLMQHAVVRQLAADARGAFPEQVGFPQLETLDQDVDAHKIYTPLAADSSQLAAVLAAARGKNFVLEGPPGTGKSQTIANMIAHCLGHGKTVLFVAEKAVALDVVKKRLERIGLGDFCLELHSNKTLASSVMQQFRRAVECTSQAATENEWDEGVDTLTELRAELNRLPREMHLARADGESLYADVCRLASIEGLPELPAPRGEAMDMPRDRRKKLLRCAHDLAAHYKLIAHVPPDVANALGAAAFASGREDELQAALQEAAVAAHEQETRLSALADQLGVQPDTAGAWRSVLRAALAPVAKNGDCTALLPQNAGRALSALQSIVPHAAAYRKLRCELSLPYPDSTADAPQLPTWLHDCQRALTQLWPLSWWNLRRLKKQLQAQALSLKEPDTLRDLQTLNSMREHKLAIAKAEKELGSASFLHHGVETTEEHLQAARSISALLAKAGDAATELLRSMAENRHDLRLQQSEDDCRAAIARVQEQGARLSRLLDKPHGLVDACDAGQGSAWAEGLLAFRSCWREIALWNKKMDEAQALGAEAWAAALLEGAIGPDELEQAAAAALSRGKLDAASHEISTLREFAPLLHEEKIRDFATEDRDVRGKTGDHIRRLLTNRAASISQHGQEAAILQRELSKKRMHMPLRRLLAATPHIAPLLKPCFLMSPLSVAQYLTDNTAPFDVVIFDEASQIPVWDAIGAIGRGRSVIITGDSRQMPPTSFFSRSKADDDEEETEPNLESILDECIACGVPRMYLTWHYRSRSESLITFSNQRYYEGKMTTFPAPTLQDSALQCHYVGGLYESGASRRVNPDEAHAVVEHVLATLRSPGFRYTEATSIGIVTFNAQQQKLISDLLEEARGVDLSLEPYFAEDTPEAIFVKNLENVQGDERGVIYFSTTYGRDAEGRFSMNFGPLTLSGGERRLNVAVTRARYAMHVFTSMRPEEIDLSRTQAQGTADLRAFLEYARSGGLHAGANSEEKDALARHIAARLAQHGFTCRLGLGASDYRVDIAVERPEDPHTALAGITLDGAAYHAAYTARDRDVVRPEAMYSLGWRMLNVWAIDWWRDPERCLETLVGKLNKLRELAPAASPELPDLAHPLPMETKQTATRTHALPQPAPAAEYSVYEHQDRLRSPFEMTDRELAMLMLNIAEAEAPLAYETLMQRLSEAAPLPPARGLNEIKAQAEVINQRMQRIYQRLLEHGLLYEHMEPRPGEDEPLRIAACTEDCEARPRSAGPRELLLVPPSEIQAHAQIVQMQLQCLPASEDHLRGICKALGMTKVTRKAKEYIAALLSMPRE